jgi:N-acetylglutamate synthase-like GNAT family acetyltransferase
MIIIKNPKTREDFKAYYDLRYQVLRDPWGLPKGTEKDDYEPISQHYMAVDSETGDIVGVVKIFEKNTGVGQFSHMAVAKNHQRQGIGHILISVVEEAARKEGYKILGCLSRLTCTDFFEKCGYQIVGLPAHYFGTVQVVWMEKKLD